MLGFEQHNWSAGTPTTWYVPSPIGPIERVEATHAGFPTALRGIVRPRIDTLWYVGRLPSLEQRAVAMVGSRGATRAACDLAAGLAGELVQAGYAVVSGGALGIDAAAHRGALDARGITFAVLGCGVDIIYPDRHGPLFAEIAASGGLLSQFEPGCPPRHGQFPVRNRIVAALAEAVVVVEARGRSGALITARLGRELGRRVLAVPGSVGTDQLIAAGATPVEDAAGLLAALDGRPVAARAVPEALVALIDVLRSGPASPYEVSRRLGVTLSEALGRLAEAELAGWARRLPGGRFEVPRAS
jgi:DNA processing protein